MKISTKGRYALRMLFDIACHSGEGVVSLTDVSERQMISKKYLEQIVPMLTRAGILRAMRGNRGGYSLVMKADELTVGDVLRATEGSLAPVSCLEVEPIDCPHAEACSTLFVWQGLYEVEKKYLDSVTLQDIVDHSTSDRFDSEAGNDYCI